MSESEPETIQPIFHGSPSGVTPPAAAEDRDKSKFAAGVAFGIGSAALVAALLYSRRKPKPRPAAPPVDPTD